MTQQFGFQICDEQPLSGQFAKAEIYLGSYSESFLSDLAVWSKEDYLIHWNKTCKRLMEGASTAVFCTSYSPKSLTVWPVQKRGSDLLIFNYICSEDELLISDFQILFKSELGAFPDDDDMELSKWIVPIELLTVSINCQ